ncbi:MAG TPA: sensor histidine kinase, partial [Caulobacteraceae bacterium]|nr:sensor histidine kinase [Caulobacteraceae bacterium]
MTSIPAPGTADPTAGEPARARLGSPATDGQQGRDAAAGRLRTRTLILLRWLAIAGQTAALLAVGFGLRFPIPWLPCLVLIGVAAALNLALTLSPAGRRTATSAEATAQLAFDIIQLSGLLFLTGGVVNPFCLLLIAPVTVGAATLPARYALGLWILAVIAGLTVATVSLPMPWAGGETLPLPAIYRAGCALALTVGVSFTAGYAFRAASESARMELALHVTETVLAREQRLSALGALAAAAAHELGTPLATIAVVAKELARETPAGPLREDAWLMVGQAQRCRDILRRLAQAPETADALHERMSLLQV